MKISDQIPYLSSRFWARCLDYFLIVILTLPAWGGIFLYSMDEEVIVLHWSQVAYLILVPIAYEWISLVLWSATPGKYLMGLVVVSKLDQGYLTFSQALLRAVSKKFDFFFGYAPYFWALTKYDRRTIIDLISGTQVLYEYPVQKRHLKIYPFWALILIGVSSFVSILSAFDFFNWLDWNWPIVLLGVGI